MVEWFVLPLSVITHRFASTNHDNDVAHSFRRCTKRFPFECSHVTVTVYRPLINGCKLRR